MTRQLVIKGESLAGKSDVEEAALVCNPFRFFSRWRMEVNRNIGVRGTKRVGPKGMLDVVGQQFLMLLFVMKAENDAAGNFVRRIGRQQALHSFLYMTSVFEDGLHRGTRKRSTEFLFRLVGD